MLAYLQFVPLFTAFFVALILLVVMTPLAHQFGLVDQPSARKRHAGIIPLTGGVAIFMAVLVASVATDVWMKNDPLFFTASAFVVLLGMLDDRFDLSAKGRLMCQFGVAAIMAWSAQNYITSLGNIFGTGEVINNFFIIIYLWRQWIRNKCESTIFNFDIFTRWRFFCIHNLHNAIPTCYIFGACTSLLTYILISVNNIVRYLHIIGYSSINLPIIDRIYINCQLRNIYVQG